MSWVIRRALLIALAFAAIACEGSTSVPSGATQVRVVGTGTDVRLDPASVPAGDVYLVLAVPDAGVDLVETQAAAGASPGPLGDADLARLGRGDLQGFSIETLSASCCGPVVRKTLGPGRYAFVPAGTTAGQAPTSIAVLEVVP